MRLNDYYSNTQKIYDMNIMVRPLDFETFIKSQFFRSKYGLLVNDSLIAAIIQEEGIKHLATNDNAFFKVDEFNCYQPTDLKLG